MRWIAGIVVLFLVALGGLFFMLWGYPKSLYSKWMEGTGYNRYYEVENFRPLLLTPVSFSALKEYKEEYPELWKDFPIRSTMLPLPVRHPLFSTVPIIDFDKKFKSINLGISFLSSTGRENSRIYALPPGVQKDYMAGLELFKLPYVKNRLVNKSPEEVWKDIFTKDLKQRSQLMDSMIYDLYLLYIRSKLLPKETIRYGLISNSSKAVVELESKDRDYIMELVMIHDKGSMYSFVIRTEKNNQESQKLRTKFLTSISFSPSDTDMARILYTEFKALNLARQVDQEGMLYLFSAWSQDTSSEVLLKEMIFYLERGSRYHKHLSTFYKYAFAKYGKTFTTRDIFTDRDDPEIALQRKIELEGLGKRRDAQDKSTDPGPELTPDERMNEYLKKAKQAPVQKKDEMTIH